MATATLAEALDFAISMERAAVAFYKGLLGHASFAAQKSVLSEFMAMEEGHVTMLSGMQLRGTVSLSAQAAADLGLARQLAADEKPAADMSYQDIIVAAIKKEERSGDLYVALAASAEAPAGKAVFERLAVEEGRHRQFFEELYELEIARDN
ncbi:MAG: hypothetical protein A2Y38_18125 [Spirochaetes bacterium GWB1_59_5]|nr:MAG: hypothetical protein A2Y38_18125 [Spirochaetes bacterium GWB1_59_5]